MIGEKISPILEEIELCLLDSHGTKPDFNHKGFRAAVYIFQSVIMDSMFALQESENIPMEIREDMAEKCGFEIRALVKKYTNIDTHKLYE